MEFLFQRGDLETENDRGAMLGLSREYFAWMDAEIIRLCDFSIAEVIGMDLDAYVHFTVDIGRKLKPEDGGIYFLRTGNNEITGMGGLRKLPDGAAEIVRIYTRPSWRGNGCGRQIVHGLLGEARKLGYKTVRLDTGVFMVSAHKIYEAAGFVYRDPYVGGEPPPQLVPYFRYMEICL